MIHSPPLLLGESRMIATRANSEHMRNTGRCFIMRAASSFSRCSGTRADMAPRDGALRAVAKDDTSAGVNALGNRRWRADMTFDQKGQDISQSWPGGIKVHTSTALQISFSVLHLPTPSTAAPAISSMYFSKLNESMSLRICSRFSAPIDWRIRLIKAVCLFNDESSLDDSGTFQLWLIHPDGKARLPVLWGFALSSLSFIRRI